MDSRHIDLPGSAVEAILLTEGDGVVLRFSRAYLIQTISGARDRTRWYQSGELAFEGVELAEAVPEGPLVCAGGDVGVSPYTYRDMLPIPLVGKGAVHCDLRFVDTPARLKLRASRVVLKMEGRPHYIEHTVD